ncbi:AcrR family transcriptional regulator [Motilibacter peucedani]|uniref:AcrR family transcriptional regulator n=1 Tax=Motilibacter peucedani TaxID=598650 RepID=A0A420XPP6_9ACTN|nr:TetR/AcrR family transcriptional regulator [Motilibacter peucedani]RKS75239.1 AcrR family transcriptional regulator [Motilibacter peucedani]
MPTAQTLEEVPGTARPGGRSARVRAAVHRAVEELLAELPPDALSVPLIAARAGVHPTTVYRRWPTLGDLLAAVAASRFSGDLVTPDTGTLRGDLETWVSDVATDLADPDALAVMRAAVAAGTQGGCACVADRHAQLAAMLEREQGRGGSAPGLEAAVDSLLAPLYYRAIFTEAAAPPDWARERVDALLGARS